MLSLLYCPTLTSIHEYWGKVCLWLLGTFASKVMSLLFNMVSRFVIAFLPRSNHLLILWLQSPSTVILEPKKIELMTDLDGYLYTRVHSNIIHTSPKVETVQVFISKWMNKHSVLYLDTGILFGHKKEGNPVIFDNMNGPWGCYSKGDKSDRQRQILYDITYMWNLKNTTN